MAKSTSTENTRTNPVDVAPPESNGVIAAWDGLYHAFSARWESVDTTPDGLVIHGLTFDGQYNADEIIRDVNHKGRRVPLYPTILWLGGMEPAPFADAQEMTAFMVQNFKGSVQEGTTRAPDYVKAAFAALKTRQGIASKRGPKTRTINLKNLSTLDASTLKNAGVSRADIEQLIAVAQSALAETAPAEATS